MRRWYSGPAPRASCCDSSDHSFPGRPDHAADRSLRDVGGFVPLPDAARSHERNIRADVFRFAGSRDGADGDSALEQSHVFVGVYWQRYGWIAPGETVSGLEDEYDLSGERPKLIYLKHAKEREPRLDALLARIERDARASYKHFSDPGECSRVT